MAGGSMPTSIIAVTKRLAELHRQTPGSSTSDTAPSEILGIREDLEFVERTWRRVQAAIADAQERAIDEEPVRKWLWVLTDLANEAEYLLDSFQYQVVAKEVDLQNHGKSSSEEVRISHNMPDPSPLTDETFRRQMADGVTKIKERFEEIRKEKETLGLQEKDGEEKFDGDATGGSSQRATSSGLTRETMFGRELELEKLVELLVNPKHYEEDDDGVDVVAVVGMGGTGKTTIAQHAFMDVEVAHDFAVRVWVCVSDNFDVSSLTKDAISALTGKTCSNKNEYSALQIRLNDAVQGRRFLLVVDDLWNEDYFLWETFTAPLRYGSAKGSKILITTRNKSVEQTSEAVASLSLKFLSDEDGWLLFKRHAFRNGTEPPEELAIIGKEIVKKCRGLPLSIKVIASLLYQGNGRKSGSDEKETWSSVLKSSLLDYENARGANQILGPLLLSYRHLPSYLKPCFGLCSIFPKGNKFSCKDIIRLWNANGFLQVEDEEESENKGMKYISDLCSRSLLQMDGLNEGSQCHKDARVQKKKKMRVLILACMISSMI